MKGRILVVDDDRSIRDTFRFHLDRAGHEVHTVESAEEALAHLAEIEPEIVITDIRMGEMDGLELLHHIRERIPDVDVVVITAHEDMRSAVTAMREGAYDYLVKPLDLEEIELLVERCLRDRDLRRRAKHLTEEAAEAHSLESLVGEDPAMIEVYKLIGVLAGNRAMVLIRGETGTGKEMIARAVHFNSPSASEPFVAVNCSAVTPTLLESELFGHVQGAFTGAVRDRKGYFELAGSGTVFLDEIGDTPPEFQAKLLRVLEDAEYFAVGGERPKKTTARVMAATHRDLEGLVEEGSFREDLYFRLRVMEIRIPPLRDRKGDIPLLARHLLQKIGARLHKDVSALTPKALDRLASYPWPGNVRELENALMRAAILARGGTIDADHLALEERAIPLPVVSSGGGDTLETAEVAHIQRILDRHKGNKRQAALTLGISRPRLDRLIQRHGLRVGPDE